MSEAKALQLNNRFSLMPEAFLGKDGGKLFKKDGKRRTASTLLCAGVLYTRADVLGDGCTTSYSDLEAELHYARATIARAVAENKRAGIVNRYGQSKYTAGYSVDKKHGLTIYHFLRDEKFNRIRLTGNDVIFACNVIRHYLNDEREQKYFIGGEIRIASFLNVALSTAHGVAKRLLKSGVMHRFILINGKLSEGKGINGTYPTVYIIDDEILKRVKQIRKQINKQRADKEALMKLFSVKPEPTSDKPRKRKPRSLVEQWNETFKYMATIENSPQKLAKQFANDITFNRLKNEYERLNGLYFAEIKLNGGAMTERADELEAKLDSILSDVLNFLLSHNVPRTYIPENWKKFIIEIIKL